jgi:hypothetical protein
MPDPIIQIVDPLGERAGRVRDDGRDWVLVTYEFLYEDREVEATIALTPEGLSATVVAILNGLGFPQSDLEYIVERLERLDR